MNVATKVGRYFLNLVNNHFLPHHKFSKIFYSNNIKISYIMPNMKSRISIQKKSVTNLQPPIRSNKNKKMHQIQLKQVSQ